MPPGYPVHSHPPKVQRHGVGAMNPMDLSAASHRAGAMNLEIPGTGFPQHPVVPGDMHFSGGYPAVTIGAAGYGRGNSPQGFVPGGSLKTIPMTGLTPTAEKNEPVWENIPRPPPSPPLESGSKQYDPNNWVKQANKSAFPVLNEGNDFHQESKSGSFGNILAVTSQIKLNKPLAPSHTASIGKGKAREIPEAIEQIPLPPPPPPMLGYAPVRLLYRHILY